MKNKYILYIKYIIYNKIYNIYLFFISFAFGPKLSHTVKITRNSRIFL